jgi:hypothetical protein
VEDALAANYPHLSLIDSLKRNYVIGAKEGDHAYLFDWIKDLNLPYMNKKMRAERSINFVITTRFL